jgi:hypothetical protein
MPTTRAQAHHDVKCCSKSDSLTTLRIGGKIHGSAPTMAIGAAKLLAVGFLSFSQQHLAVWKLRNQSTMGWSHELRAKS